MLIMNKQKTFHLISHNSYRFRRFCRAAYAIFNSLHREVTIGRLASYVADHQLRKSAVAVLVAFLLTPLMAQAQEDDPVEELALPAVQVVAQSASSQTAAEPAVVLTSKDISNHSVHSVGDLLTIVAGIDLRVRGVGDAQGDLSMRGGSFDQMLVLINGINLTDAQTGHHLMDVPIDISMVERIEILTPSMLLSRGIVAFCGAINIVVNEKTQNRLVAELGIGSYGTARGSVLATASRGAWSHTFAGSYARSDGYMGNTDYRQANLYWQSDLRDDSDHWTLSAGVQMKDCGSQAFYSISYPDQFEATRTATLTAMNEHRWSVFRLESALYGRLHSDRFELFREGRVEAPSWYGGHNYHLSEIAGVRSRLVRQVGRGDLFVGIELRSEGIVSSVLGTVDTTFWLCRPPSEYNHRASRLSASLFGGYRLDFSNGSIEADALGCFNSVFGFHYGGSLNAVWQPLPQWRFGASLTRTFRMPTFTDLYYQSVNQVSNPDLNSESSLSAEVKARYSTSFSTCRLSLLTALYYRAGRDIIDWIRRPDEEVWYSMNHTVLDAMGAEISLLLHVGKGVDELGGSFSYCTERQDAAGMVSGYALDYLRHKGNCYLVLRPAKMFFSSDLPLRLKGDFVCRHRVGEYVDKEGARISYPDAVLLNLSLEYAFPKLTLAADVHNVTDCQYRDYGGVPQPGRTFMLSARLKL